MFLFLVPTQPRNFRGNAESTKSIVLSWDPPDRDRTTSISVPGITTYIIYYNCSTNMCPVRIFLFKINTIRWSWTHFFNSNRRLDLYLYYLVNFCYILKVEFQYLGVWHYYTKKI